MNKDLFTSLKKLKLNPFVKKYFFITFLIFLLLFLMLFLPWQQTIKGSGILIAYNPTERYYNIYAPISGFIQEYYVQEDQFVKKGTSLFKISDLDTKYLERLKDIKQKTEKQLKTTYDKIRILEEKIKNIKEELNLGVKIYENKLLSIQEKIKSLEIKKLALKQNLEISEINYKRIKALFEEGIESKRKYELEKNKLTKAKADFENAKILINIEKQNLDITKKEKEKFIRKMNNKILTTEKEILTLKVKEKSYKKEIQKIASQISKFNTSLVKAEKDGYIIRILKNNKNQYIKKGETILIFSPVVNKRAVLLKVNDFDMPLIKEGLETRIWFYGWPAIQIPGWPKIRYGTYSGKIEKIDPILHDGKYYYAYITETKEEPWPESDTLRIGTKATVWIALSTVPIWYELWRKINAFPPNMVNIQPSSKSGG